MTTHDFLASVFSWWPFVMLIGAYILISRYSWGRCPPAATTIGMNEQLLAEMRRTSAALERIEAALDKRRQD